MRAAHKHSGSPRLARCFTHVQDTSTGNGRGHINRMLSRSLLRDTAPLLWPRHISSAVKSIVGPTTSDVR